MEEKWYDNLHWRYKMKIYLALASFMFGLVDLVLSIFGFGLMHWTHDILWMWGSFAILGTATIQAIDSKK